ncbi:hypothetical protein MVES1_000368 [Malassezia vespertilionis]|uniref:uncharacterized protein n=1 Tax=Malassezia vespertilionis TaxID=2020962 RepID=UPI0024B1C38F|nr:uncharacterized protein MVES1_000368 [Malassezia vespertilionis]WFD05043.1 hypothetical protein MVES1_000368 [Malassezia vespertilionis]
MLRHGFHSDAPKESSIDLPSATYTNEVMAPSTGRAAQVLASSIYGIPPPASLEEASDEGEQRPHTAPLGPLRSQSHLYSSLRAHPSAPGAASTSHFIVLTPPADLSAASLPPRSATVATHTRRGILLPLYPTLGGQLYALAREYGLPSIGGISLYLQDNGSGEGGPRIGDATWATLWSAFFEEPAHDADGDRSNTAPLPYTGKQGIYSPGRRGLPRVPSNASLASNRSVSAANFALENGHLPIVGRFEWAVDPQRARWWRLFIGEADKADEEEPVADTGRSTPGAGRRPLRLTSQLSPGLKQGRGAQDASLEARSEASSPDAQPAPEQQARDNGPEPKEHTMSAAVASISAAASRFFGGHAHDEQDVPKPQTPKSPVRDVEEARERLTEIERHNAQQRRHAHRASIDVPRSVRRASQRISSMLQNEQPTHTRNTSLDAPAQYKQLKEAAETANLSGVDDAPWQSERPAQLAASRFARPAQAPSAPALPARKTTARPLLHSAEGDIFGKPPWSEQHTQATAQSEDVRTSLRSPITLGNLPAESPMLSIVDPPKDTHAEPTLSREESAELDSTLCDLQRALDLLSVKKQPGKQSRSAPPTQERGLGLSTYAPISAPLTLPAEDTSFDSMHAPRPLSTATNGTPAYVRYGIADTSSSSIIDKHLGLPARHYTQSSQRQFNRDSDTPTKIRNDAYDAIGMHAKETRQVFEQDADARSGILQVEPLQLRAKHGALADNGDDFMDTQAANRAESGLQEGSISMNYFQSEWAGTPKDAPPPLPPKDPDASLSMHETPRDEPTQFQEPRKLEYVLEEMGGHAGVTPRAEAPVRDEDDWARWSSGQVAQQYASGNTLQDVPHGAFLEQQQGASQGQQPPPLQNQPPLPSQLLESRPEYTNMGSQDPPLNHGNDTLDSQANTSSFFSPDASSQQDMPERRQTPPNAEPQAVSTMSPMSPNTSKQSVFSAITQRSPRRMRNSASSDRVQSGMGSPQSGPRGFFSKVSPKLKWPVGRRKKGAELKTNVSAPIAAMPIQNAEELTDVDHAEARNSAVSISSVSRGHTSLRNKDPYFEPGALTHSPSFGAAAMDDSAQNTSLHSTFSGPTPTLRQESAGAPVSMPQMHGMDQAPQLRSPFGGDHSGALPEPGFTNANQSFSFDDPRNFVEGMHAPFGSMPPQGMQAGAPWNAPQLAEQPDLPAQNSTGFADGDAGQLAFQPETGVFGVPPSGASGVGNMNVSGVSAMDNAVPDARIMNTLSLPTFAMANGAQDTVPRTGNFAGGAAPEMHHFNSDATHMVFSHENAGRGFVSTAG